MSEIDRKWIKDRDGRQHWNSAPDGSWKPTNDVNHPRQVHQPVYTVVKGIGSFVSLPEEKDASRWFLKKYEGPFPDNFVNSEKLAA
jgi:hypothetical protein